MGRPMRRGANAVASLGESILAGAALAFVAALGDPFAMIVLPIPLLLGAIVGVVLSPAAIFARADAECRPTFLCVVLPTAALTFLATIFSGIGAAFLLSIATYLASCGIVVWIASRRRRRLDWYSNGLCSSCGYDVRNLEITSCPECGEVAHIRPWVRLPSMFLRP